MPGAAPPAVDDEPRASVMPIGSTVSSSIALGLSSVDNQARAGDAAHRPGARQVGPAIAALTRLAEEPLAVARIVAAYAVGTEEDTAAAPIPAGVAAAAYADRLPGSERAREEPRVVATAAAAAAPLRGGVS